MGKVSAFLAILALAALLPSSSQAGIMLSLSTPGADLSDLDVGDTITFDVLLSGLASGDSLEYLAATVTFSSSLFELGGISPGVIVPEADGFLGLPFSDGVDGSYDFLFAPFGSPISANGVFFTFDLTIRDFGTGTVSFDFVDAAGFDSQMGLPLVVNVAGVNAVPEPSSLVLLLGASAPFACGLMRQRRSSGKLRSSNGIGATTPGSARILVGR